MRLSPRYITLGIVGSAVIVASAAGIAAWLHRGPSDTPRELLKRLPTQDAVVAGIDFRLLRAGGYLNSFASHAQEEAEYKDFLRDTGFDYTRDLDYLLASFAPDGTFFLAKGTFSWPRIEQYTLRQKGSCYDHVCRLQGSTPQRQISFLRLRENVMAMAVSTDDLAATRLTRLGPQQDIEVMSQPVWLSMSAGALRRTAQSSFGPAALTSVIANADRLTLTVAPSGTSLEARLEAICRDAVQAGTLLGRLRAATAFLKRSGPAQPDNFAALLAAGTFDQAGARVLGTWPVQRSLIDQLTGVM